MSSSPPQIDQGRWLLRSALAVAPSPPSSAPFLIIIIKGVVAIVALLILLRFLHRSR